MAIVVVAALAGALLLRPSAAAPKSKLTFEDRIAAHATTSVTVVVRRAAAFSVRFRVSPTNGRTRVTLTGAKAPKGGPLLDTKGVGCDGAAGSWVCEGSYEALPPGTYTFRIRHDASVAGSVELNVSW